MYTIIRYDPPIGLTPCEEPLRKARRKDPFAHAAA